MLNQTSLTIISLSPIVLVLALILFRLLFKRQNRSENNTVVHEDPPNAPSVPLPKREKFKEPTYNQNIGRITRNDSDNHIVLSKNRYIEEYVNEPGIDSADIINTLIIADELLNNQPSEIYSSDFQSNNDPIYVGGEAINNGAVYTPEPSYEPTISYDTSTYESYTPSYEPPTSYDTTSSFDSSPSSFD